MHLYRNEKLKLKILTYDYKVRWLTSDLCCFRVDKYNLEKKVFWTRICFFEINEKTIEKKQDFQNNSFSKKKQKKFLIQLIPILYQIHPWIMKTSFLDV